MNKLSHEVDGDWVPHSHPPIFAKGATSEGGRLEVGVPGGDATILKKLVGCLRGPFFILYVLHTPRGEGEAGRYQSPSIDETALAEFIDRHTAYLARDARFDLWVHSPQSNGTLVWDRHNLMFGYGPIECFRSELVALGFAEGEMTPLGEHQHHYRAEFDSDAASVLSAFSWTHSPLRPEDEQFRA